MTKAKRWRTGWLLALTYLLCTLIPAASVAMSSTSPFIHCMTGDMPGHDMHMMHHTADAHALSHDMDRGSHKPSHGQSHGKSHGQCCGVMCVPALPVSLVNIVKPAAPTSLFDASPLHPVAGEPPPPRYRPPIA